MDAALSSVVGRPRPSATDRREFGTPPVPIVLWEDADVLVVNKPPGLPTMGVPRDQPCLWSWLGERARSNDASCPPVHVLTRLDARVSGVVLVAKHATIAAALTRDLQAGQVEKKYVALVEGVVAGQEGVCQNFLVGHPRRRRTSIVDVQHCGARRALLHYRVWRRWQDRTFLEVRIETGRKHQIRVQLAAAGHPIIGDRKYGGPRAAGPAIALHARAVRFFHPVQRTWIRARTQVPEGWRNLADGSCGRRGPRTSCVDAAT
ncbi:MAG: RluA family pseudouridine synthase [Planctomycetota bacterium]